MNEEQHLRDVAQLCRREAGNSITSDAKRTLSALAEDFEQRANEIQHRGQEQRIAFLSATGCTHLV
jgi:hypothetical protein